MSSADSPGSDPERGPPETVEPDSVPVSSDIAGPFFQQIGKRKLDGRDAKILVTADNAETGVGKSNLCDFLAYIFDTTEEGFRPYKVCVQPEQFFENYKSVERGSSMVLEEAEQLDSRRAMSTKNVESARVWQQERVREVIALLNLPSPTHIDKRMQELADYWINVERRGRAVIYKKKIHRIKQSVYYETVQIFEWPNMDGSQTFREMNKLKWDMIDSETEGTGWISRAELEKQVEKAKKEVRQETRNEFLAAIYNETGLKASDIATLSNVDLSASRIRQIGNGYN